MPKIPEVVSQPPKKLPEKKLSKSEKLALAGIFEHKVVCTRQASRYAHLLVGEKTLCGLSSYDVRELDGTWNDYAQCLRCSHTMTKVQNMAADANG
jgi:hypothetical protein